MPTGVTSKRTVSFSNIACTVLYVFNNVFQLNKVAFWQLPMGYVRYESYLLGYLVFPLDFPFLSVAGTQMVLLS